MMPVKPIKICFIDFFAYSLFNPNSKIVFGGAQIQLYFLAKALAKIKKFAISFLTDNGKENLVEDFGGVTVYQFLRSPQFLGYWQFFVRLFLNLKKINAQVYVQRAASAETGLIALIAKSLRGKFIYMVAHEQDVNGSFVRRGSWRGKFFLLGLTLADKIVCQTRQQQNQLPKNLKAKSVIIPPAYPIKPLSCWKSVNKQGVLWVARAEKWKNPELFLALAAKFPRGNFTMICPPAESNPNYFKIIKKKANEIPNLTFIEKVPFNKIDEYFAKAKVFVSTSLSEGFPNTFIQAAKNMTPIISFKVNPDKIIDKYQIGFCAEGDERQMIILLKELLKSNQLWQRLATNAYNYARQCHDIKKTVRQYQKLFEREYS